jgi:tetratricopeptide (TPR) repeat protein
MAERTTTRVGLLAARVRRSSGPALSASRARARDLGAKLAAREKTAVPTRLAEWRGWPYAGSRDELPGVPNVPVEQSPANRSSEEPRRRALELNARGVQLRRAGDIAAAIDQHDEAIDILRRIGDRRAQAPALNGLALALVAAGETDAAVERFEESLEILRDLDDRDLHDRGEEARVTANLGFTLLKQGADERARELLAQALEQLPPESPAAHQVEAQLRRAS